LIWERIDIKVTKLEDQGKKLERYLVLKIYIYINIKLNLRDCFHNILNIRYDFQRYNTIIIRTRYFTYRFHN